MLNLPGHSKHDVSRSISRVAAKPAYEALAAEMADTPGIMQNIAAGIRRNEWADNFLEHPLVKDCGPEGIIPLGLYIDGVQYQRRNSTIGFWVINLMTQRRHLMVVLQKRDLCRCGCKGYCSLYPTLSFVEWSIASLVSGMYPATRHDGPWEDGSVGKQFSCQPLGFKAVPVLFKGDWAEFAGTLGFRSWAHHGHPCFRCFATGGPVGTIKQSAGLSAIEEPWATKTMTAYEQACSACEVKVQVNNRLDMNLVVGNLQYDKRRAGSCGRALIADVPRFRLCKGDRLEPSISVPDIAAVELCTDYPIELTFWRVANESLTRHRCPIFSRRSCILPEILCVDELHTMHLGCFQDYVLAVFWHALECDVWDVRGHLQEEAYVQKAVLLLRGDLFAWYKSERLRNPGRPLYELGDLQVSMIGTTAKRHLHAKAAESGTLAAFAFAYAEKHRARLPRGSALVNCGRGLMQYMDITRSSPLRMTDSARQAIADAIVRYTNFREAAVKEWKPKVHLCCHFPADSGHFGNPLLTGTWLDEGLNMQLAAVCRSAHAAVWSQRVLASFGHSAGPAIRAATLAAKKRLRS